MEGYLGFEREKAREYGNWRGCKDAGTLEVG